METLGTADPAFVQGMMPQLARVANQGQVREDDLNFMLSIMQGIAPRDEIEGCSRRKWPPFTMRP